MRTQTQLRKKRVKVSSKSREELLLARQERLFIRAFKAYVARLTKPATLAQVTPLIQQLRFEEILRIVDRHIAQLSNVLSSVFIAVGYSEVKHLADQLGGTAGLVAKAKATVSVAFDPLDPSVVRSMQQNKLGFVQQMSAQQRSVTRNALVTATREGLGTKATAKGFVDSIGLTTKQASAVENYRALLEQGSKSSLSEALGRNLRDRRFDGTLEAAHSGSLTLSGEQIDKMVGAYQAHFVAYRAETIARTEMLKIVAQAQHAATRQVMEQAEMPEERIIREWRATRDERTRDTHWAMDGQKVKGMDTPFKSPSGAKLLHPGDVSLGAPAEEIINCRCVVINTISPP